MAEQSKIENQKSKTLFEPGRYSALPNVLLRRRDLSASAKLVWMALAGHLGPDGTEVWPSINRLAGMTGLERKTAIRSVASLEAAGLVLTIKTAGRATRYRILQPQADLFEGKAIGDRQSAVSRSKIETGTKNVPVPKTYQSQKGTGTKKGLRPVPKRDSNYLSEVLKETPPLPPKGEKSGGGNFSPDPKQKTHHGESPVATKTEVELVRQIDAAHVEAFGKPLPAKWKRDIRLEYADGDRASLERIDADVLLGAEKYRAAKQWTCLTHGTVMHYLAHLGRQDDAKRRSEAKEKAQADAKIKADAVAEAKAKRRQTEATAFFQTLPAFEQGLYLDRIRGQPHAPVGRPALLNLQAALLAFGEKMSAVTV